MEDSDFDVTPHEATLINCRRALVRVLENISADAIPEEFYYYAKQTSQEILQVLNGQALKEAAKV